MKRLLVSLCFFTLLHGEVSAQYAIPSREDRLIPATSFFDMDTDILEEYCRIIRDHLISTEEGRFMSRFWAIPSFSKEYFVGTMQKEDDFFLICREPKIHIWTEFQNKNNHIPKIVETKRRISKEDAVSLNLLIEVAVVGARFDQQIVSDKDGYTATIGADGTGYYFSSSTTLHARTASIRSPRPNSKTGQLVAVLEEVIETVKNKNGRRVGFSPELRTKIEDLTAKFLSDI